MSAEQTSVLVVGGGLVGLSAAVFLSKRGVPTVLAERHANCSPHPRAMGFTPRTRELYRAAGLEPELPPAPGRLGAGIRRVRVESLAGKWFEELPWGPQLRSNEPAKPVPEYSPCGGIGLAQNRLELILRQKANEFGADIRFSTELVSFTQDCDGVQATLRTADGETSTVSADYLVAADGNRSPVREALGVSRDGQGYMHTSRSVLFRAPLQQYLESGVRQFAIDQAGIKGMLTTYGDDNWGLFLTGDDTDRDDDELMSTWRYPPAGSGRSVPLLPSGIPSVGSFLPAMLRIPCHRTEVLSARTRESRTRTTLRGNWPLYIKASRHQHY
jgi:putative polyketide hydroxylase